MNLKTGAYYGFPALTAMPEAVSQLPPDRQPALRVVPMPADTNAHGVIFGGWVMSQVDLAGSVAAMQRALGPVVTVAVNSFQFKEPVHVGDLVSFYAHVEKVGRTSITVVVDVYAERRYQAGQQIVKVTEAALTYVAIDSNRKPRHVPEMKP